MKVDLIKGKRVFNFHELQKNSLFHKFPLIKN